ncbi:hypothetical protein NIG5292_02750 [Nereida ignava]|uniref:Uncharacterized protein n=1 Tax=Nereida ignava TaxID=282199 RepID=A0A0U1NPM1_9RHOB|nr:hypothetical protein NIG5292_02750 [Nereida ignava]
MAGQSFCAKRLDWDAPVTEVQTLRLWQGVTNLSPDSAD